MKKVATVGVTLLAVLTLSACGSKSSGDKTYDKDFINSMENGLDSRWTTTDQAKDPTNPTKEEYSEALTKEYDAVKSYKNKKFKNDKLHEEALAYINAVKEQKNTLKYYNDNSFVTKWNKAYDKRTEAILKINKQYKLKVDQEHEESLAELTRNGDKVMSDNAKQQAIDGLIKTIKFKETKDDSGFKTYDADVKNNTNYSFKSFGIKVQLKASNGTVVDTIAAYTDNWSKGQTNQFEIMTDKSFKTYTVIKDYVQ